MSAQRHQAALRALVRDMTTHFPHALPDPVDEGPELWDTFYRHLGARRLVEVADSHSDAETLCLALQRGADPNMLLVYGHQFVDYFAVHLFRCRRRNYPTANQEFCLPALRALLDAGLDLDLRRPCVTPELVEYHHTFHHNDVPLTIRDEIARGLRCAVLYEPSTRDAVYQICERIGEPYPTVPSREVRRRIMAAETAPGSRG